MISDIIYAHRRILSMFTQQMDPTEINGTYSLVSVHSSFCSVNILQVVLTTSATHPKAIVRRNC